MAKLRCPTCDTSVNVKEEKIGSSVLCDACGEKFVAKSSNSRRDLDDEDDRPSRASRRRDDDDDDRPARSSRRRDEEDDYDYDDEPRPKKKKKFKPKSRSNTNAAAFVFAGAIFLGLITVVGGLAYYFASKKPAGQVGGPVAVGPNFKNVPMAPIGPNPNQFGPLPPGGAAPQPNIPPPAPPGMPQGQPGMPQPQPGAVGDMKATLSNPRWGMRGLTSFDVDYNFTGGRPIGGRYQIKFKSPDGQTGAARMIGIINQQGTISIQIIGGLGQVRGPIEIWMEEGGIPGAFGRDGTVVSNRVTLN